MGEIMEDLEDKGLISTTDPRHMGELEVRAYVDGIKRLDPGTQALRLRLLSDHMCSFKNRSYDDLVIAGEFIIPSAGPKPIRTISPDDLALIFEAVDGIEGWPGSMSRGMISMYFGSGQRPSELRQSNPDTIRKLYANFERANAGKQLQTAWKETPVIETR
jgi:integrase